MNTHLSPEHISAFQRMLLLDSLFRERFLLAVGVLQVRRDYDSTKPSAYDSRITASDEHRRLFGYLLTDPNNSCRVVFCCLRHGFQVQATRDISKGDCATFYDGIRGDVPRFTGTSAPSSMFQYSPADWQAKIGSYTHVLSLGEGESALDGKWLPPTTAVGFASFCNSTRGTTRQPNVTFIHGSITAQNGLRSFVARAVARTEIKKDDFLNVDYSFKAFEAVKMTDFMALDSFDIRLKQFFETSYATLDALFPCQDQADEEEEEEEKQVEEEEEEEDEEH
jgi:hypothetical protein